MTPDYYFPGGGVLLQDKLGLGKVPTLDIRQQCTGFIYGLQVADALLRTKVAQAGCSSSAPRCTRASCRGAITASSSAPRARGRRRNSLRSTRAIAIVPCSSATAPARWCSSGATRSAGSCDAVLHSDGHYAEKLYVPSGFKYRPYITEQMIREGRHIPEMDGQRVFRMAVSKLPEVVHEVLTKSGHTLDDVSLLLAHQANLRLNEAVQKALGLGDDRVYNNIQRYGNTTAATIPILYDECRRAGRIKRGDLVCFVALGAGFHWGAALWRE